MIAVFVIAMLGSAEVSPQERRPTWVTVTSPEACPQGRLEKELSFRTNRVRLVSSESEATAFVEAVITHIGKKFEGQLKVRTSAGQSSKKLVSPKCETVIAAMSLTAALVLDPEHAKVGVLPKELPPVVVEPIVEVPPVVVEPVAPPIEPPKPVPPPVVVAPPPAVAEPAPHTGLAVTASALGLFSSGTSGQFDPGGGISVEVAVTPAGSALTLVSRLAGAALAGRTISNDVGRLQYALSAVGQVSLSAAVPFGRFRPEVGALLQLNSVQISGLDADVVLSSQRWLWAVGPHARLAVSLGQFRIALLAMLGINLRRERYIIQPQGVVATAPGLFGLFGVELGYQFFQR